MERLAYHLGNIYVGGKYNNITLTGCYK